MKSVIIAAVAALTTASLHGQTLDWDFAHSFDGELVMSHTYTSGAHSVTVSGFVIPPDNPVFHEAALKIFDGTIGMERGAEDPRVDNADGDEFVLFTFSTAMTNLELRTMNYWETADHDVEYWYANIPVDGLTLKNLSIGDLAGLGFTYGGVLDSVGNPSYLEHQLTTPLGGVTALIFGPPAGQDDDAFKIDGMSALVVGSAPEPSTAVFLVAAASLLGVRRRRIA
jgi:hypothetical protein